MRICPSLKQARETYGKLRPAANYPGTYISENGMRVFVINRKVKAAAETFLAQVDKKVKAAERLPPGKFATYELKYYRFIQMKNNRYCYFVDKFEPKLKSNVLNEIETNKPIIKVSSDVIDVYARIYLKLSNRHWDDLMLKEAKKVLGTKRFKAAQAVAKLFSDKFKGYESAKTQFLSKNGFGSLVKESAVERIPFMMDPVGYTMLHEMRQTYLESLKGPLQNGFEKEKTRFRKKWDKILDIDEEVKEFLKDFAEAAKQHEANQEKAMLADDYMKDLRVNM